MAIPSGFVCNKDIAAYANCLYKETITMIEEIPYAQSSTAR